MSLFTRHYCVGLLFCLALNYSVCLHAKAQTKTPDNPQKVKTTPTTTSTKDKVEWGEWNTKKATKSEYGVGIKGTIESELSKLDKSNLLNNANGVTTTQLPPDIRTKNPTKSKDIKKMMRELESIEEELTKELNDESEF